ncbi:MULTISPECIES: dihydrolipoamide acetyltransferase family protein [Microbacterium]|uniref:Dihydrolipoamide acetyltransferase component of pyruvate dehydrogenase complex n=1 Tax=Microbacterium wangchenii TaxID=2541726 RepID=A0ABX5SUY4_9MICO|nr:MULTISPECIES: dihydrolipoamide acetyltransferase family protein [Microbacterium]MCK6065175.1 2-oxo acid dehydrogenase subunit E2 [Microbacterium sp. EYE_512]QBR88629.1 2-oxo acid dehydrogenase subunit E2 [Microbacterium wangchenii]TFV82316.1 2-oxo acid dehydrogenase subunit E2 [Microbacterium sp. dk485]TXK20354.1 2-oxo acid dehydrogenase subunit E2 [Microbacterium wangchenii]
MIQEFRLPDLGEGLTDAELVQWLVAEGEAVALNQALAEVETAKAVVELPSPFAGAVQRLHAAAGDTIEVGAPLVTFTLAGADAAPPTPPAPQAEPEPEPPAARQATLVGYGALDRAGRPRRRARRGAPVESPPSMPPRREGERERPRSSPPVRRLAKTLGVDLESLEVGERPITRADVEAAVRPAPAGDPRVTRIPIRGVRKHTAAAMVRSAFTAPHAATFVTIDVTETQRLLEELARDRALQGHRIGILAVVAKAVCLALGRTPVLGSRWDEAAGEIVQPSYVNLGVAVATDRGLVVPNVPDADGLSLVGLADALAEVVTTARAGALTPAQLSGGTFTITNVGVFGVDGGVPILNPGEAGILAVGAVRRQPWEHEGAVALRDVVTLSLSFDHRLADGAEAAGFLMDVAGVLRAPGRAMLLR